MDRNLRRSLKNHTIIILNITGFVFKCIDVPLCLNFVRMGQVWSAVPAHCLIWWLADIGFYYACCMLVAWMSIERHILIFLDLWLSTRKKRILAHYLPSGTVIVYAIIWYTWMIFIPPCENTYDYSLPVCGDEPCYLNDPIFGVWDILGHGCIITIIIIIFSVGLVVRVIVEKHSRHQPIIWCKHRKITVQMLFVSSCSLSSIYHLK